LDAPSTGTAFRLADSKPDDKLHYKSLFAVPIFVGATEEVWGVAMATSNKAGHFGNPHTSGVQPEEAVRSLAGLTALAVSVVRATFQTSAYDQPNETSAQERKTSNGSVA
jgi:hypothetical protein